jgi:hypothetical protein
MLSFDERFFPLFRGTTCNPTEISDSTKTLMPFAIRAIAFIDSPSHSSLALWTDIHHRTSPPTSAGNDIVVLTSSFD